MKLPKHVTLTITHNEHKVYYETVANYVENNRTDWVPGDSRQRAIDADDMWSVHWYPDTPVAYSYIHAHTLEELLDYINA